jgi:hypothetical protein
MARLTDKGENPHPPDIEDKRMIQGLDEREVAR